MNSQVLYELVQNHVVQSSIAPSQLTNGFTFTNLNGDVGQVLGEPGAWSIEDANILGQGTRRTTGTCMCWTPCWPQTSTRQKALAGCGA